MKYLPSISSRRVFAILALFFALDAVANAQGHNTQPDIRTYKTIGTTELKAHIFSLADTTKGKLHSAIILLHGGGWNAGSPEWTYEDAKHFASLGVVAVAGEYRLSDQKNITPLEAMADVRDLIRWLRDNATDFAIDPHRIAVYGLSAGAHLAAGAAVFPHEEESKTIAVPDALLLVSPAVSLTGDHWPQILLGNRAEAKDISPADNIKKRLPPIIIIEGSADTVTPLAGVQHFCEHAKQIGGACELHVYPGVGHLLSRNLDPKAQEQGPFDLDPVANADAHAKEDAFLRKIGYTN